LVPGAQYLGAARVERCVHDRGACYLRLVDGRHRLRPPPQIGLTPVELRRVDRGQVHHRDSHVAALLPELGLYRFEESTTRELRSTVWALQGDAEEGQRRPDVDDRAGVASPHALEGCHRAPHLAEEGDGDCPGEVVRLGVDNRLETVVMALLTQMSM